mgnify:CR=1 FL=1|tara:strand:+ start:311 stop:910 length:600 start_codon:yes stop_codon:yes gene_type:complete
MKVRGLFGMKRSRRLAEEEEGEPKSIIGCKGANVYFHSHISKQTILEFIEKLHEAVEYVSKCPAMDNERRVFVYIHSEGGDMFAGLSAMNHIRTCPCKVVTIVDGFCASAATIMYLGSSERWMMRHSQFLIHQLTTGFFGKYCDLKDEYANTTNLMHTIEEIYSHATKIPSKKLQKLLKGESYMTTDLCLKYEVCNKIV